MEAPANINPCFFQNIIYIYFSKKLSKDFKMAKKNTVIVRMESSAGTGYYKIMKKNPKKQQAKLEFNKYDPVARKHVKFVEKKYK